MIRRRQMMVRGLLLGSAAFLPSATACSQITGAPVFTPEAFGAVGDGITDDTAAFQKLSSAVNSAGGGRIVLRSTVYRVGQQHQTKPGGLYRLAPAGILRLAGCTKALVIEGNRAVLRSAAGLRYGAFDAQGRALVKPQPHYESGVLATPYDYMILISDCSGAVTVRDLELDGAVGTVILGGPWGDTGWQVPAVGLFLRDNSGDEVVSGLYTHHHAQDGLMIAGPRANQRGALKRIENVRSQDNGRQGCSVIGGRDYSFSKCRFARTGRGRISSAPGAGVDIEAETAPIRNLRFDDCEFTDNSGCGLLAEAGDIADVTFAGCRFVGTSNWSLWPNKPGFTFTGCKIVGAFVNCFGADRGDEAVHFIDCHFTDDPAGIGKVFFQGPIGDLGERKNVLFSGCLFEALHGARLPWSTAAIYENCVMRYNGLGLSYPRGRFRGRNKIDGKVDIGSSRVEGPMTLNGAPIPPRWRNECGQGRT